VPVYDLVIRNGKVVTPNMVRYQDIYVSDGRIQKVGDSEPGAEADTKIDAEGLVIIPGLIDSHVHFRDPGMTHKEDFESGSKGAAAGGTTAVFDMPTTSPVVTNARIFKEKLALIGQRSVVDFGLYGAASVENLDELRTLAEAGAIAFKTYMVSPPKERLKEYSGAFVTEPAQLLQLLEDCKELGLPNCLHAEDDSIVSYLTRRLISEGKRGLASHFESRPWVSEAIAVYQAVSLAQEVGGRVHILHVSTKEAVSVLRRAKAMGVKVTAETCPHYLYFTEKDAERLGPNAKFNPPPRTAEDSAALWEGLREGTLDAVVSDHAPHSKEEKDAGKEDIWRAPPGTPGVETRLPAMLVRGPGWGLGLQEIVRLCSTNVARIFGIGWRKGDLKAGMDADITILDPNEVWTLDSSELQTKARETVIFESMQMRGRVKYTIVRGRIAYEQGVGFGKVGLGEFVPGPKVRV
jgi:allantoinase